MTEDRTIPATARSGLRVALIGGGRWARVHAGVLQSLEGWVDRLIWVSRHNRAALTRDPTHGENVEILDDLQEALRRKPDAAVVCTASARHAGDAMLVVRQRIPVLVEKPLAPDATRATELIELARRQAVPLCVCLPLLASSGLRRFKQVMDGRIVTSLRVRWFDPAAEVRYGETKNTDITTHKADEFIPHLWSLIDVLIGPVESLVLSVAAEAGDSVSVTIAAGQARVEAEFGRQAPARVRHIDVEFAGGGTAEFEFAQEPGRIHVDGQHRQFDNATPSAPRPLASIHTQFLDLVQRRQAPSGNPFLASRCIGTVRLAQDVRSSVIAQEAKRTAALLGSGQRAGSSRELARLMLDNLGPELSHGGIRVAPDDLNAQARLVSVAESEVLQRAGFGGAQGGEGSGEYRAHLARSEFIARVVSELRERSTSIAGRSG